MEAFNGLHFFVQPPLLIIPLQRYNIFMLKEYLNDNEISVYHLAKESGIAYSTLNDLVNGKVDIDKCRVSLMKKLAVSLQMSMDELYDLCKNSRRPILNSYDAEANLTVRAKYYHASIFYNGENTDIRLCKVTEDNSFYIDDIARWRVDEFIREKRMRDFR